MDIMELGAIGELVGGVAVIATLAYLAAQVRQSNRIARNSAAQSFREANSEFVQGLYSEPEVTKLYLSGLSNRDALSAEDRIRFDMMLMLIFRTFESQYLEHLEGYLSAEVLNSYERSFAKILRQPGARSSWDHCKEELTARVRNYVDQRITALAPAA